MSDEEDAGFQIIADLRAAIASAFMRIMWVRLDADDQVEIEQFVDRMNDRLFVKAVAYAERNKDLGEKEMGILRAMRDQGKDRP